MSSPIEGGDISPICPLPPIISPNQREKVRAEEVDINEIKVSHKDKPKDTGFLHQNVPLQTPFPLHPLAITWSPDQLVFEINDDPIVRRLWVWNSSTRSIYIHCCDIWDENAYLGARWRCYPQMRFLLAPGLKAEMFVRASPKEVAPVPCARARLQLAAAHKRDCVVGYFSVPVSVRFLRHVPYVGETDG